MAMDGTQLLAIGLALLFIGSGIFYIFVYPIWMVIDAGISERSNTSKALWIIGMVLTWSIGAVVYGTFAAGRTVARVFGVIGLLFVLASGGLLLASILFLGPLLNSVGERIESAIAAIEAPELSAEERQQMLSSVEQLFSEAPSQLSALGENPQQLEVTMSLLQELMTIIEDQQITRAEYLEWMRLFENRKTLTPEEIEQSNPPQVARAT